ncbi:hypothetical protein BOTBODRAFT_489258 [Botryobasidium botryosum FD-172 SS1]|uniref:RING-type domain-containing protein n=1 Tax=Botryobasidium botryosum (strain FD-172 SS1) TaxID=930990 RepID=A0A067M749_BOTB1|nr:hypothetical protein BOTBODRAFT_489258 [Botryobasidium botryosum FD-172 SS1]
MGTLLEGGEAFGGVAYLRELGRLWNGLRAFGRGLPRWVWMKFWGRGTAVPLVVEEPVTSEDGTLFAETVGVRDEVQEYQRFLRGEAVSDDEDDGWGSESSDSATSSASQLAEELEEDEEDPSALYADLEPREAPVLIAHYQHARLTRHGYAESQVEYPVPRLRAQAAAADAAGDEARAGWEGETRRNCVVCTAEPRVIISWPCRCLALCDDCRANIASRQPASKHTCPCCRRSVEGYSRIYLP